MIGLNKDVLLNSRNYYMQVKYREKIKNLCDALSSTQIISGALCVSKYHEDMIKEDPWLYYFYQTCTHAVYHALKDHVAGASMEVVNLDD